MCACKCLWTLRQPKIKYEKVLKEYETPRSESIQTVTGKEQRTNANSTAVSNTIRSNPMAV